MPQLIPDVSPKNLTGLLDKTVGLARETAGTLLGKDSWREAGQQQQKVGEQKIEALQKQAEAEQETSRAKGAKQAERAADDDGSAGTGGVVGKVSGTVKERAGGLVGNEDLRKEGKAQGEKGEAQTKAEAKRAEAQAHEKKAESHDEAKQDAAQSS